MDINSLPCMQMPTIAAFVNQDLFTIPEGKSEELSMKPDFRIVISRDPLRSTHFVINAYRGHEQIAASNPNADDVKDKLAQAVNKITTIASNELEPEIYMPDLG